MDSQWKLPNSGYEAHVRNENDKCKRRKEKTINSKKIKDTSHSDIYEMVFVATLDLNQDYASEVIELKVN